MPQYLFLAETIYKKMKNEKLFSKDVLENMYILMKVIRKEIKGTEYKLKYNFIDFNEVLSKSKNDCKVKIDVSLIPSYNLREEYILWLAGFIQKITEEGPKPPPPIKEYIPEFINLESELDFLTLNLEKNQNNGEEIVNYFNSKHYKATFKK
ncbi:hypothetical protein [Acinetobacter baumannii]|uniref:hypothetical protein n=1 Tax=Acinetobacter baumannii TaxID=470 RepID=UPI0018A731D3|nr:hypothetical protein [Acinetobacter baumannii]MBF8336285.1 hypothetical protein [Acinetobacter baumannii]